MLSVKRLHKTATYTQNILFHISDCNILMDSVPIYLFICDLNYFLRR